jgi:cellulose synthase/poly-beta-1,6-N-acetylglucosamine synthase-like glycosyltransferase
MAFRTTVGRIVLLGSVLTFAFVQYVHGQRPAPLLEKLLRPLAYLFLLNYTWTILRWITYEPQAGITDDDRLPRIDVVIPAYNESAFIRESMNSVIHSNYPQQKIHLIVVDDGSNDDTWLHIVAASKSALECQIKFTIKQHEQNAGKRQALVTGFNQGDHEVLVTLDSDSILTRNTLRNLVTPLVLDPRVGGVAGHLSVANTGNPRQHSFRFLIPRLLEILFQYGGNIPRSAQTKSGFVVILPGANSAFRRAAIRPHIATLNNQTFLGHSLRHGEDIELAMKLLQDGWRTVYQSSAIIFTKAPETAYKAFLMYIRWERSSYTYLLLGLLHLTYQEARQVLKSAVCRLRRSSMLLPTVDKPCEEDAKRMIVGGHGDLYPILNLMCTSLSSIMYVGVMVLRLMSLSKDPWITSIDFCCLIVLALWNSLLFIPEALRDDWNTMRSTEDDGTEGQEIEASDDRRLKLLWKLQYASLSVVFQTFFISWATVIGMATLRSQKWLTR